MYWYQGAWKDSISDVTSYRACDDHQFGFKKDHSTTLCTAAVKQTIDYYTSPADLWNNCALCDKSTKLGIFTVWTKANILSYGDIGNLT